MTQTSLTGGFRNIVPPAQSTVNQQEQQSSNQLPVEGSFRNMSVGFGAKTWKADERGMWLGSEDFSTAPFAVSMTGEVFIRGVGSGLYIDENGLYMGDSDPATAPLLIDYLGNIKIRASAVSGSSASQDWYDDDGNLAIHIGF